MADLSARLEFTPNNVDYLDAECRTHLGAIEEISLLGVAILITVKFHMFPSATCATLFRLEFAKLGTSASQDTHWNFRVLIIWEKPFKLMKNSASEKLWRHGFLVGVPFNRLLSIPNYFLEVHDDLLFGVYLAIAKFLALFCHDTIATTPGKRRVNFGFRVSLSFVFIYLCCFRACHYKIVIPILCYCSLFSHLFPSLQILGFLIKL